jgi:hypothetical protein
MTTVCLQAGHQHIQSNCRLDLRGSTGAPGEAGWTVTMRGGVAALLRAQKTATGAPAFSVVERDANLNCDAAHPRFDLTLAIHYQSNTGHSGFGVFVPDPSVDRDVATSIKLARALAQTYAARVGLPNYSSPRLGLNRTTWENPNTLFYYVWSKQEGPLALIECGEGAAGAPDHNLLYLQQGRIASAIAEGICAAFGVKFVDPAVEAAARAAKEAADLATKAKAEADAAAARAAADAQAKADAAAQAAKQAAEAAHAAAAAKAEADARRPASWQDVLIDLLRLLFRR